MRRIPLSALIGLILTGGFFFVAIFAQLIAPYKMDELVGGVWEASRLGAYMQPVFYILSEIWFLLTHFPTEWHVPFVDMRAQFNFSNLPTYWLGTDSIGRDLLTRMIYGAQVTIFIATASTILSFVTGSVLGFLAATAGGWLDQLLSRFVDLLMAIPTLILSLVILTAVEVNTLNLILVIGFLDATRVFRLSRAVAVDITVMDYVEAARLRGEGRAWIIFSEILPNALSPLVAELGLRFIFAVLFISTLSFLGLGVQPPMADWGGLVKENSAGLVYGIPAALAPAFAIAALAISVNLVADWVLSRTTSLKGGRGA